jgi:hypothetical protein
VRASAVLARQQVADNIAGVWAGVAVELPSREPLYPVCSLYNTDDAALVLKHPLHRTQV